MPGQIGVPLAEVELQRPLPAHRQAGGGGQFHAGDPARLGEDPLLHLGAVLPAAAGDEVVDDRAEGVVQQDAVDVERGKTQPLEGLGHGSPP